MTEPIVFYDLAWKVTGRSFSPSTWKARYCLNVKGIPSTTVWVEFPDIAPLCKRINAPPTGTWGPDGSPMYTLPVIYDPNTDTVVAESTVIARYLDKTYPDTLTVIPKETAALDAAFYRALWSTIPIMDILSIMVPAAFVVLNPASAPYFRETRERFMGAKIEEIAPIGSEKRAKHWEAVKKGFHEVARWLSADGSEGRRFFLGADTVCYADIRVAAILVWIRETLGEGSDEWKDVLSWDGGRWAALMDEMRRYELVDAGEPAPP
ncbi:hypothetical protein C8Q76DRAFT_797142 [Earliella scabrosa]|nr:hypothetical protein C8Q76DRAFT_797142 [Earliella scabrosa]